MRRLLWTVLLTFGSGDVGTAFYPHPLVEEEEDVARFDPAKTLRHEGLYTLSPNETWRGIDRKHHPDWSGWAIVDSRKVSGVLASERVKELADDARLNGLVEDFYRDRFWRPEYEGIEDQEVGVKIFDLAVNMGHQQAHKLLQRAVRATGQKVVDDGVLGPVTLAAINEARPDTLLAALKSEAAGFYRLLAAKDSTKERYLAGWLGRSYEDTD